MQEISRPLRTECDPQSNITDIVERQGTRPEDPVLFRVQKEPGEWEGVRASQFRREAREIAKGLIAHGIEPGDRVGIMSRTRYEWAVADLGIMYAGGVTVPVYETSSPSQIAWNLGNSEAKAVVVETQAHADAVVRAGRREDLDVTNVWIMDAREGDDASLAALKASGEQVSEEQVDRSRSVAGLEDLATIIYTSGTTGKPKGCELTHGNFVRLSAAAREAIPEVAHEGQSTLMFLPLAHVFARYIHVLAIDAGVVVGHTPDLRHLTEDMASFGPDFLLVVPRVFEKIYNGARAKAYEGSDAKGKVFDWAEKVAVAWSEQKMQYGKAVLPLRVQHALAHALVYSKLREAMGGNVRYAVSGGGPLATRLGHFFHGTGIKILEGYGLTETTAPAAVGTVEDFQIGTVGPPLPGTEIRIAEDGEVLMRGVGVISHYYRNEEADREAFTEDGWFRSGDLGELTDAGMLKITGRKKEVLVTAGGKNVIPSTYEDAIRASPLVSQCVLIGDGRPFISALVTLDEEALPKELPRLGLDAGLTAEQAAKEKAVQEAVQKLVDSANESVSKAESVRAFRIIPQDFTEESGHLTPSLKIRRPQVVRDFTNVIEDIYSQKPPRK